jgi:hypothetical protein
MSLEGGTDSENGGLVMRTTDQLKAHRKFINETTGHT